jgi:hypothetical protein
LLDVELYAQGDRLVLHLVNLTGVGSWRAPMEEIIPGGPVSVSVRDPRARGSHRDLARRPRDDAGGAA